MTSSSPRLDGEQKVRRDLLLAWLRKVRKRRRTISTLLLRGWHR